MESAKDPERKPRWGAVGWFLPAAVILLLVSLALQWPWPITAGLFAIPLVIGLLLVLWAGRETSSAVQGFRITSRGARSEGRLTVPVSTGRIEQVLHAAVDGLHRFTIRASSAEGADLAVSWSIKTWGERISLRFTPTNPSETEITGVCTPKLSTTLIDYGQGAEDLQALFAAIRHEAKVD